VAGLYYYNFSKKENAMMSYDKVMNNDVMVNKDNMSASDTVMIKGDKIMNNDIDKNVMQKSGSYEIYSESKMMNAKDGKLILDFSASWCPSCQSIKKDIQANLSNIPVGVSILEVDYDKYSDLKKKYLVTTQHTFVQVDMGGNVLNKWTGGSTLDDILKNIK
jgi:thiol-disulfide isomerase/thioredoxin